MEFWLSRSLSHELFSFMMEFTKCTIWGKTLSRKTASLKTLPLDLEPLCKEKSTVLLILMQLREGKLLFFS
jgi:hypothetical protein